MSSNLNVLCETQGLDVFKFTTAAPGSAGDVVAVGNVLVVLQNNVLISTETVGILKAKKIKMTKKTTDVIVPGNKLYWDAGNKYLTLTAGGNTLCAIALEAAGNGATTVVVKFDGGATTAVFGGYVDSVSLQMDEADFTDSGVTGTLIATALIPANNIILGWQAVVATGFATGNTTAILEVGSGADLDRYNGSDNPSVFAAGTVGNFVGTGDGLAYSATAVDVKFTITVSTDFTGSGGDMTVEIFYIKL